MLIQIGELRLVVSPVILAAVASGIVVFLIILIVCCCCCCCRRRNKDKNGRQKANVEQHPQQNGNQNGGPIQQRQQQFNPPRMPEQRLAPNSSPSPPPAAASVQKQQVNSPRIGEHRVVFKPSPEHRPMPNHSPHRHSPTPLSQQSNASSNNGNSLPPQSAKRSPAHQIPSPYMSGASVNSNPSNNGSNIPPSSPLSSLGSSQIMFTYEELAMATYGFSKGKILGEGGFGFVHKGVLPNGKEVAVKSLKLDGGQGEREFQAEVEIISRVHHKHLVSLVGYCISGSQRLLVYEFVPNHTLEFHLHGKGQPPMEWSTRMTVAVGAAKGLAYLHEDCHPKIIHRDIKTANILLDENFEAKVADFGLAKVNSLGDTHVSTRIMGTMGYLAPEYASSGQLTAKSDVYSFGVMLLELITGRKPIDRTQEEMNLVEWARPLLTAAIEDENFNLLVDPRIQYNYKHSEMSRMVYCAATCVRKSARKRPQMSQVVRALEGNMSLSDLSVGITPGRSMVNRFKNTSSDYSSSQYNETSKEYGTSSTEYSGSQYKGDTRGFYNTGMGASTKEYYVSGTTSEFGLHASSSSSDDLTTRELDTEEVQREIKNNRHHQRRF